jgi:hypothetical protein
MQGQLEAQSGEELFGRYHDIADKILVEAGLMTSRTNGVEAEV